MMPIDRPLRIEQVNGDLWIRRFGSVEGDQIVEGNIPSHQPVKNTYRAKIFWKIRNISSLSEDKHYSSVFELGGCKWRILMFPRGNIMDGLSLYLDVAEADTLPCGWSKYVHFGLTVVNQVDRKYSCHRETQHKFNAQGSDFGFTSFMPLFALYDPRRGYFINDSCVIEADLAVYSVLDQWAYDSKKETGFVGLRNQGATCYMNSLLQTLYHIPCFRKLVYHMPSKLDDEAPTSTPLPLKRSNVDDEAPSSTPLALKSIFYKMQYGDYCVSTKELTNAFGWKTCEIFLQHDVQELNRKICEILEDEMKGTEVDGSIKDLFEGHHINYIECISIDYKSTRKESFYDIQLDVKGCRDVYASFDKFVEVENLNGDNKYHAAEHGLQDAKKGVLFTDFPPVLQLHLKRFEFDFERGMMIKINDRYEFPLELDLDRDDGKYLSPEADRTVRNLYKLHSVLVHSGRVDEGHYYAFVRPTLSSQWYRFDDELVIKEDIDSISEVFYGGEVGSLGVSFTPSKINNHTNAYMLVYVRDSDIDKILCDVSERDITEHLRETLKREQELKQKEKAEAGLWTVVKVASDEDFALQIGKPVIFDLVDHDKVASFCVQNIMPFSFFKGKFSERINVPVRSLRFWLCGERRNSTYRPTRPLSLFEEAQTMGFVKMSGGGENSELKLFVEVEQGMSVPLPIKAEDDILLFFKLYDPDKEELRYAGRLLVNIFSKPEDILSDVNKMAGFAPDEDIELYEEFGFVPKVTCKHIVKTETFKSHQLGDGDIICFQKSLAIQNEQEPRCPDVPSYLEHCRRVQDERWQLKMLEEG